MELWLVKSYLLELMQAYYKHILDAKMKPGHFINIEFLVYV